jgi:hypothetical protein
LAITIEVSWKRDTAFPQHISSRFAPVQTCVYLASPSDKPSFVQRLKPAEIVVKFPSPHPQAPIRRPRWRRVKQLLKPSRVAERATEWRRRLFQLQRCPVASAGTGAWICFPVLFLLTITFAFPRMME